VRVWVASLGDNKPARMLKLEGSASEVHWSPQVDWLAVALAPRPLVDDALMFRKVHLVNIASGAVHNLQNPGKMGQISWSPDGKAASKGLRLVVGPHGAILEKVTASADGKVLAFVGHSPRHPPEVFLMGEGDKEPRRLTDSNPWLRTRRFAAQEVVKYKARD